VGWGGQANNPWYSGIVSWGGGVGWDGTVIAVETGRNETGKGERSEKAKKRLGARCGTKRKTKATPGETLDELGGKSQGANREQSTDMAKIPMA